MPHFRIVKTIFTSIRMSLFADFQNLNDNPKSMITKFQSWHTITPSWNNLGEEIIRDTYEYVRPNLFIQNKISKVERVPPSFGILGKWAEYYSHGSNSNDNTLVRLQSNRHRDNNIMLSPLQHGPERSTLPWLLKVRSSSHFSFPRSANNHYKLPFFWDTLYINGLRVLSKSY